MQLSNQELYRRFEALQQDRKPIEAKWEKVDRLIVPFDQGAFAARIEDESQKNWSSIDVWDSTAPIAQERLVALFYAGLISGQWTGLEFYNKALQNEQKATTWLADTVDNIFNTIMSSNFPVEFGSLVSHWVNYGNGCMAHSLMTDYKGDYDGFDYQSIEPRSLYFETDYRNFVYRSFKPVEWTAVQIVSKFRDPTNPEKPHPSIPSEIIEQTQNSNGVSHRHKLLHVIDPREGVKPMGPEEKARAPDQRPFREFYILEKTKETIGEVGGLYEMPVYVTRYMKASGSNFGYGPSMLVLPSVGLINGIQEQVVDAGAKVLNPASLVTEWGLMSDLKLGSGEYTVVRSVDDIKAYESGARFDVSDDLLNRHAAMIRKYYREDEIAFRDSPQMSATEASLRDERLNALFGIPIRRVYWECLSRTVQGTFNHMLREGQLDKIPDILLDPKMKPRIKINFHGRFARAIRTDEAASIERLLAAKGAMVKLDPNSPAKHVVRDDLALRELAERLGTPKEMMQSEQSVTDAIAKEQQMREMAAQAEIGKTAAEGQRAAAGAQEMMKEGMGRGA